MPTLPNRGLFGLNPPNEHTSVEVIIEIPRGGRVKRDNAGRPVLISPLACPFNYGSIPSYIGLDDDFLDAVVLGPALAAGTRLTIPARGAIGLLDADVYDDKLVCSEQPLESHESWKILAFFHFYARAKRLVHLRRGRWGASTCLGWRSAKSALAAAASC